MTEVTGRAQRRSGFAPGRAVYGLILLAASLEAYGRLPKHIDKIDAPILLIHGCDETVVRYEQSQAMYGALRQANKHAESVTLKHEDHWLSHGDTRLQMLQASVEFLRRYNPPD